MFVKLIFWEQRGHPTPPFPSIFSVRISPETVFHLPGQRELQKNKNARLNNDTLVLRNQLLNRDTPLEPARLSSMIAESNRLYGPENMMSKMLVSQVTDHVSEANDSIYEPTLQKLKAQGILTTSIVKSMK